MHQNYFRDYRPELGRYLESDPIGLRGGVNLWGYVSANALKAVDYSGMIKWEGSVVSLTAGPFPFAGVDHYKLKSECKCGKRISLSLSSYYVGFPVAATWNAPACFEDKSPCPNAQSLSGLYQKPFVSLTWGIWGGSLSRPTSGDGISCWGWSNQRGLDISAGIAVGYSNPRVISEEDCCDD